MVRILKSITSDDVLAAKIKDDDQRAFKILYNRYFRRIYYFSIKYLQNKVETEDLVQTAFVSLWEHRKSLDLNQPVKSYLYKSVTNLIYNCLKKRAIRSRYIEYELRRSERYSNQTYDQVYFNDLEKSLDEIVTALPAQQQRIFYLSRGKGYSYERIAQKLNLSVRTVENQIYRTLKVIRKSISSGT